MQYPHTIRINVSSPNTRDENGNPIKGSVSTTEYRGRFEINSQAALVRSVDGQQIVYDGIIYMPKPEGPVAYGVGVEVIDEKGNVKAKGKVVQYSEGFFNARIWL
jgi:hypothetical protein